MDERHLAADGLEERGQRVGEVSGDDAVVLLRAADVRRHAAQRERPLAHPHEPVLGQAFERVEAIDDSVNPVGDEAEGLTLEHAELGVGAILQSASANGVLEQVKPADLAVLAGADRQGGDHLFDDERRAGAGGLAIHLVLDVALEAGHHRGEGLGDRRCVGFLGRHLEGQLKRRVTLPSRIIPSRASARMQSSEKIRSSKLMRGWSIASVT